MKNKINECKYYLNRIEAVLNDINKSIESENTKKHLEKREVAVLQLLTYIENIELINGDKK